MNGELIAVLVAGIVVGWFACRGWDWLTDWWFNASGGWLKDVFALIGVIAVCLVGWRIAT